MDLNEKLQALRKQRGLTQEDLAKSLFVSRTAISKWESGRGYPSIDSLKAIADFFCVTVDDLISDGEIPHTAEETQKPNHRSDHLFGLLDLLIAGFLLLPVYGQNEGSVIRAVSIFSLHTTSAWLKIAYWIFAVSALITGLLTLSLRNCKWALWLKRKHSLSILCNALGAFLFILSLQPYAACFWCASLAIKLFFIIKRR